MKRREFISRGILTLGGVFIGQNISYAKALDEISDTFTNNPSHIYDVVINGAGLNGFFTALEASRKGLKVLVLDRRTSPGFDIAAKRRLWIGAEGFDKWNNDLINLFLPEGELPEIWDNLIEGKYKSHYEDQLLLFGGSLKKGMLRTLLTNKVDTLLMADVCGIITDISNKVSGVAIATKHGLYSVRCGHFIDASDNCLFTRDLFSQKYNINKANFVFEVEESGRITDKVLAVDNTLGLLDNKLYVHKGKKYEGHYLFEFNFNPDTDNFSEIEQQARLITARIGRQMPGISPALAKAKLRYYGNECSYDISDKIKPVSGLNDYDYIDSIHENYTCNTILSIIEKTKQKAAKINKYTNLRENTYVHYIGGKSEFTTNDTYVSVNGKTLPLSPFRCDNLKIKTSNISMLIVGGGTAGSMIAFGAIEKGYKPTVVEYFNDLGGTKTVGGVNDYYFGYQAHEFIKKHKADIKQVAESHNMKLTMPRSYFYLKTLTDNNCPIINSAVFCKAEVKNEKLEGIIICNNGRLERITAQLTVDATGDADVAYMAGEGYEIGDSRMGVTQNYSHWDIPFRPKIKDYNRDYDIINSTEITEHQRGLYLAHYESHYYDFYPMQAIRESRRPKGVHRIDTISIMKGEFFPDTIVQARSDFDPHYFGSSEYSRCVFMLPHYDNKELVNIPYRSIVPASIDGLLFSGKAISESYKALQFTRMSADVTTLGYVTGLIASEILKQGVRPRDFSVRQIQKELQNKNYLPPVIVKDQSSNIEKIVQKLSEGSEEYLFKACLEKTEIILPALEKAFTKDKKILLAKALAWHGNDLGVDMIISELNKQYGEELQKGHPSTYFEVYDPTILYWKINQNIGLLSMCGSKTANGIINRILSGTKSGGKRVAAGDPYNDGRIDLQLVPYYNRIANLCFYVERNPDKLFISGLEKLLKDENVKGYKTEDYSQTRWRLYGANLELFIAAAAARSGSEKGVKILIDYLADVHSDFRKFAAKELKDVYGKDNGFDTAAWQSTVKNGRSKLSKVTPLITEIEV